MKLKVPIPNTLYRWGLLFMIIKVMLSYSSIVEISDSVDMVISVMASLFLVGSVLQKRYPLGVLFVFAVMVVLGAVTSVRTGNLAIFIAILTCLATCRENLDNVLKFMLFWEGLYVILTVVLSAILHFMGVSMLTRVSGVWQYNFGFSHPNVFSCIATNLFAMYMWLHYDEIRGIHLLTISLMEIFIYALTGSRTGLMVTFVLVVFFLFFRKSYRLSKMLRPAAKYAVPVLTVLFYWVCTSYISGSGVAILLNRLLTNRISLGAYSLNRFGVSLLGENVYSEEIKWDEFWRIGSITFDNVYTELLVTQFIWLIVVAFLFYRVAKMGTAKHCIFLLSWALYGITEVHVMNPCLFFVILMVTCLTDKKFGTEPYMPMPQAPTPVPIGYQEDLHEN